MERYADTMRAIASRGSALSASAYASWRIASIRVNARLKTARYSPSFEPKK